MPDEPSRDSGTRPQLPALRQWQSPAGSAPCSRHLIVARQQSGAHGHDPSSSLIKLQVFSTDGSAWGPEITITVVAEGNLFHPAIAALADGRFGLAWQEAIEAGTPAQLALRIQIFNADGSLWKPVPPISTEAAAG
jgi:hypothetical protein